MARIRKYNSLICVICLLIIVILFIIIAQQPQQPKQQQPPQQQQIVQQIVQNESRYDIAPEPTIPTRDTFQTIGIMNMDDKILPIYGRRINRDRWKYYTRTDTYNPVPIPVHFQKRDCMDDIGCQEIMSGDEIRVEIMNKTGKVKLYKYDGPKYIPGLI